MNSLFTLFSVGIGPSSSHTVGPMKAAKSFLLWSKEQGFFHRAFSIRIALFGSLALTGIGHGSDRAIIMGLMGYEPQSVPIEEAELHLQEVKKKQRLSLLRQKEVPFVMDDHIVLRGDCELEKHTNGLRFSLFHQNGDLLVKKQYYSIGGGEVIDDADQPLCDEEKKAVPFPFSKAEELFAHCARQRCSIAEIMLKNEQAWRSKSEICREVMERWAVMQSSIQRGCRRKGVLPGGLGVKRRAATLYQMLKCKRPGDEQLALSAYAFAVSEENASGGRIVTAPTMGSAGVIPAVLQFYFQRHSVGQKEKIVNFFLTSGAIGLLYKMRASISGAHVGCQGEIGTACSIAAAGLCAIMGGTHDQIENAAEMGMEHHLGLTCDPVLGLVQVPCIERNSFAAIKAMHAAKLALVGVEPSRVSLDEVIDTMYQTGLHLHENYKETAKGGLAFFVRTGQR